MNTEPTTTKPVAMENSGSERFAYRVSDACIALGIGRTSLYKLVEQKQLRLIRIAGRTLVPRSEIERLTRVE